MINKCTLLRMLAVAAFAGTITLMSAGQHRALAVQEKKEKDKTEGKKGRAIGLLTAKGPNFIAVKAAGEEKARKYMPRWIGGLPADGGGLDKGMLKTFRSLKIGSRIQVDWVFEERLRAVGVKLLQVPKEKQ